MLPSVGIEPRVCDFHDLYAAVLASSLFTDLPIDTYMVTLHLFQKFF